MPASLSAARRSLAALEALNAERTDSEALELYRSWTGWGPLAPALSLNVDGSWRLIADDLDLLVPRADLELARDVVDTSFYTPSTVTAAVFELLAATGFSAGYVLEPGCGSGLFMDAIPAIMDISRTGVGCVVMLFWGC